jgi:hypothetical protein
MDVTLAVATGFVYWEATHVFWKGYHYLSWEGESWKDIGVEPNLYVTMVWAVFWDLYHTKHRNRRRRWRKIYMGGITFVFQKLVVRITLKSHNNIMFFITPWSLTGYWNTCVKIYKCKLDNPLLMTSASSGTYRMQNPKEFAIFSGRVRLRRPLSCTVFHKL